MKKVLKRGFLILGIIAIAALLIWLIFFITDTITLSRSDVLNRYDGETVFGYKEGIIQRDLTKEEALEDLSWYKDVALEVHLKLQNEKERGQFLEAYESVFTDLSREIDRSAEKRIPVDRFAMHLSKLAAVIGDAHTYVRYIKGIGEEESLLRLPLEFKSLSDGLVISAVYEAFSTDDYKDIQEGMAVTAINDKALKEYKEQAYPYFSAENSQWQDYLLSNYLPYAYFNNYLDASGETDSIRLTLQNTEGEHYSLELPYVLMERKTEHPEKRESYGSEFLTDSQTALFWLDSCRYTDDYLNAVDQFFEGVKERNIEKVVVDIRENTGGSSMVVWPFLKYLGVEKTKDYDADIRYCGTTIKRCHITTMNRFLRSLRKLVSLGNLYLDKPDYPDNIFDGDFYVLVSGKTFSSGNYFATMLSDNNLAKTVGTPTGNAPSAYGDPIVFTSKNAQLPFYISYKRFVRPDETKDPATELTPDVSVPYTVSDYQNRTDPQLNWIINQ